MRTRVLTLIPLPALLLASALLATLPASTEAHAGTPRELCGNVDFRPQLGAPLDQGYTAWCYAHVAADLVSFKLGRRVSAFDLATQATLGDLSAIAKSTDPDIRAFLQRNPGRLEAVARSRAEDKNEQNSYHILTRNGIYAIGGNEDVAILLANVKGICWADNLPTGPKAFAAYLEEIRWYHHQRSREQRMSQAELRPIGAVVEKEAIRSAHNFSAWVDHHCGKRARPAAALVPWFYESAPSVTKLRQKFRAGALSLARNREKMVGLVNRALDQGKPAAIGYDGGDFQHVKTDEAGDHASVIAARRWDGAACSYFIRDSYGAGCGQYRERYKKNCSPKQGGLWVREDELKSIFSVVHLL